MYERMEFPKDWQDFIKEYKITDSEQLYSNGIDFIPVFRVEQMIIHYFMNEGKKMSKYIDRELALSLPFANGHYDHENANEHFIFGCETYKEWLETLPVVDAVEVVRCKDCRHLEILNGKEYYARCKWHGRLFDSFGNADIRTWFCADGERRE